MRVIAVIARADCRSRRTFDVWLHGQSRAQLDSYRRGVYPAPAVVVVVGGGNTTGGGAADVSDVVVGGGNKMGGGPGDVVDVVVVGGGGGRGVADEVVVVGALWVVVVPWYKN
jgi:hypothetical protein